MSSLVPNDFPVDEKAAIQDRIDRGSSDLAAVQSSIDGTTTLVALLQDMDAANQRVQEAAIADVVAILHQIVQDRDDNDPPDEAPHFIVFGPNFPVALADLYGSAPLPAIPAYMPPVAGKTLTDWKLWQTPITGPEIDSVQPTPTELTAAYLVLVNEFTIFQLYRLDGQIGSYTLATRFQTALGIDQTKKAIIQGRNNFYLGIGFTVTP